MGVFIKTSGMMVTRIFAILGLLLIGTCYGVSYPNSYPKQNYLYFPTVGSPARYGGRSSPAWNYKSNFKSPVMSRNSVRNVNENFMRSIMSILPARRFFAKRAAPDVNPDFDHFSATRG